MSSKPGRAIKRAIRIIRRKANIAKLYSFELCSYIFSLSGIEFYLIKGSSCRIATDIARVHLSVGERSILVVFFRVDLGGRA